MVVLAIEVVAAEPVDLNGTWHIEPAHASPAVDVWGQTRAAVVTIQQTPDAVAIRTEGGGIPVPPEAQSYRFGRDTYYTDNSLGTLPNFIRKVRTLATWSGHILKVESERVSESVTADGTVRRDRGITSVWRIWLSEDGTRLTVERSGYRAAPPAVLHGRPYSRTDDLTYNTDWVHYRRHSIDR